MDNHRIAKELLTVAKELVALVLPRNSYIPDSAKDIKQEDSLGTDLEIWTFTYGIKPVLLVFQGRANKPIIRSIFSSTESRERAMNIAITDRQAEIKRQIEIRQKKKEFQHSLTVGTILVSSWGYDQTNVNFYKVTKVIGKMVELIEVGRKTVNADRGVDYVMPDESHTIGSPMKKMVSDRNSVRIDSSQRAYLWDGKPQYQTAFGYGH